MSRRVVLTLVLAAFLGLDTCIFVTAWCVWRSTSVRGIAVNMGGGDSFAMRRSDGFGKTEFMWTPDRTPNPQAVRMLTEAVEPPWWSTIHARMEDYTPPPPPPSPTPQSPGQGLREWVYDSSTRTEIAYGWPCRAFMASVGSTESGSWGSPRLPAMVVTKAGATVVSETRLLPLHPIIPGVAANSALYASCWWVLLFAPGIVRTFRRGRRRACLGCGYDRVGLSVETRCPECGALAGGRG